MEQMKDYKTLLKELPSNTIVCALGEFNPPTTAHELLVKTVKVLAEQKNSDHVIYTSPSKNDLIQEDKKEHYLKLMFPTTKFKSLNESKFNLLISELNQKYKNIIIVASSEQLTEINKLKHSANVKVICINEKDLEQNHSKMKQTAVRGIYEEFKKKLPSAIRDIDGKRLMNDVRAGMGLDPIKEQVVLVKDKLREQYFKGDIFNVGDIVESNGETFEIVKRGTNHLLVKEESGKLTSKWITDVKLIKEMKTDTKELMRFNDFSKTQDDVIEKELAPVADKQLQTRKSIYQCESYESAQEFLSKAKAAKERGDDAGYDKQMARHHHAMGTWHKNSGRKLVSVTHFNKAEKYGKESLEETAEMSLDSEPTITDIGSQLSFKKSKKLNKDIKADALSGATNDRRWDPMYAEEVELEEGTFKYHMDKAIAAHDKGDTKKKEYHLGNAKTARYVMKTADYTKHKDLFDKYKQMSEEVELTEAPKSRRMSAAVKLQRAWDRERSKSDASRARAEAERAKLPPEKRMSHAIDTLAQHLNRKD